MRWVQLKQKILGVWVNLYPQTKSDLVSDDSNYEKSNITQALNQIKDDIGQIEAEPAGQNGQIQFNDNGAFGGSSNLTWDGQELDVKAHLKAEQYNAAKETLFGQASVGEGNISPMMAGMYSDAALYATPYKVERWDVGTSQWVDETSSRLSDVSKILDASPYTEFVMDNTWQKVRFYFDTGQSWLFGLKFLFSFKFLGHVRTIPSYDAKIDWVDSNDEVQRTVVAPRFVSNPNFNAQAGVIELSQYQNTRLVDTEFTVGINNSTFTRARLEIDFTVPENDGKTDWGGFSCELQQFGILLSRFDRGVYGRLPFRWENNLTKTLTNFEVQGVLSKESGSFKIKHPIKDSNYLVHSFVEAPKADLIYSGMVQLDNGIATINIDDEAGMSEGTFEALCRNARRFCTNESGFSPIYSTLSGNVLTITAEDETSTDEVFWQVIGERKDEHMINTSWTDEEGRVIVEPLREDE